MRSRANHGPARHADDDRVGRDGLDDDRVSPNAGVVANFNRPEEFRAGSDDDAIAERGMAFALFKACPTQCDAVVNGDIGADLRRLANDDADAMVDEKARSDDRAGMDLDGGDGLGELRNQPAGQA